MQGAWFAEKKAKRISAWTQEGSSDGRQADIKQNQIRHLKSETGRLQANPRA